MIPSHRPRKRFGQNFLQDRQIVESIIRFFNPNSLDKVIEIGPGQGALTKPLLERLDRLIAIEIDKDLHAYLASLPDAQKKLEIIDADALTVDFSQFGQSLRLIGNLPYNISTPLLIHLLQNIQSVHDLLFMLQKEVVDRIVAPPGNKAYGRLSVMIQYYCEAHAVIEVPPEAFYPQPKVQSAVVYLKPYSLPPYAEVTFQALERVVAQAFSMRRKTLANNLKPFVEVAALTDLGINAQLRPENITVREFAQIAKYVSK